jgi:streptogramin lyase
VLLAGCADLPEAETGAAANAARSLAPLSTLHGARLAARVDPTGQPRLDAPLRFVAFARPMALAAAGDDLYIADIGRQKVYRVDLASQVMVEFPVPTVHAGTRMRLAADRSVYVLDPGTNTIVRYARGGQRLQVLADRFSLPQPLDFVVDERRGRIVASDRTFQQLVAFHPAGSFSQALAWPQQDRAHVLSLGVMALDETTLYLADPACACLHRYAPDSGRVDSFGHDRIISPSALAVDRWGTLYVVDDHGASLKIFRGDELVETIPAGSLGVASIAAIAADEQRLHIADGGMARVASFNIRPVFRGRP